MFAFSRITSAFVNFLFVSKNYWDSVTSGKKGLGSAEWERITCLHTILSRPKYGLCIFVE
jgi:ABC-type branched-subunit amino acid transport system permease subunit